MSNSRINNLAIIILGIGLIFAAMAAWDAKTDAARLETRVANMEIVQLEMLTLLDQMVETDENLADAVMTNAESILAISNATTSNSESIFVLLQMVNDHEAFNRTTIAQIFRGHLIPLRAFHMESGD